MMALIKTSGNHVVSVCGKHFMAYMIGSEKVIQCCVPSSTDAANNTRDADVSGFIVAAEFDLLSRFFAVCTDSKQLLLWSVQDDWKLHCTRLLPRRPTALAFTNCGNFVVIADKAGDVHRFPVSADCELSESQSVESSLLLGHVSMLLDVKLCAGDKFIVTCDRDEKIRVSCYPNAYNIHSYCLGHTEYITRLCYFPDIDLLASASGDGTVKLWNYQQGEMLDDVNCSAYIDCSSHLSADSDRKLQHDAKDIHCLSCCHHLLAVSFNGCCDVLLFSIVADDSASWRLTFQHHLLLSAAVWDIAFLTEQHLLVLQAAENATAVACRISTADKSSITMSASTDDDDINSVVALINSNTEFFSSAGDFPSLSAVLHKSRTDNMKDYAEQKRLRLADKREGLNAEMRTTGDDHRAAKRHKLTAE